MNLTRRSFFRSASAAVVASAVPTAAIVTASVVENPDLLALADEMKFMLTEYRSAAQRQKEARAAYDRLAPSLPEVLVVAPGEQGGWQAKDCEGAYIYLPDGRPLMVLRSGSLADDCEDYGPRTKIGRRARRLLPIAEAYESACEAAEEASGIRDAVLDREDVKTLVHDLAIKVGRAEAVTAAGLRVKANAILAVNEIYSSENPFLAGATGGLSLAEGLLALLSRSSNITL